MKKIILFLMCLCFVDCNETTSEATETPKSEKRTMKKTESFDWLIGSWKRTNNEAPKRTFETWRKRNNNEYVGLGFTMLDKEVVWKEDVILRKIDNQWNFEVTGKDEKEATVFVVTKIEDDAFVCENEQNEFPKKIRYFKDGDNISASISGGGPEVLFTFEKM